MSTLPEQFSAAGSKRIETQLQALQHLTSQVVATTGKIASLNLQSARTSLEHSAQAMFQVLSARDPRDLLSLTNQTQSGFDSMLAYGRALMAIATNAPAISTTGTSTKAAPAPAPVPVATQTLEPVVSQPAEPEPVAPTEVATLSMPEQTSAAKVKPLAKAVARATPKTNSARLAAVPLPAAAGKPVKLSSLKAVDASPPSAPSPQLDMLTPQSKKKK